CSTLLDPTDDTNDSAHDLKLTTTPNPRNDSTPPTEKPCPDTTITDGPAAMTRDHTPTFKFRSVPGGAPEFECRVDSDPFAACVSPFTLPRQTLGRHTFKVRALNAEGGA